MMLTSQKIKSEGRETLQLFLITCMRVFTSLAAILLFVVTLIHSSNTYGLPEAARYKRFTCVECHVNPGGGGTLTSYGRTFSTEKLSTWHFNNEENPLQGLAPLSDRFLLGGDFRYVSTDVKNKDTTYKKAWRMQSDLEGALHLGNYWALVGIGTKPAGPETSPEDASEVQLRSYILRADLLDDHLIARAGLFYPRYGLMLSDHTLYTRAALGFSPDAEQTQAEIIYQSDRLEGTLAVIFAGASEEARPRSGFNLGTSLFLLDRHRINLHILDTTFSNETLESKLTAVGTSGVLPVSALLYGMFEFNYLLQSQKVASAETKTTGMVNYFSLNMEVFRGVIPYLQYEFLDPNLDKKNTSQQRWGVGSNFYPRPHLHLQARYMSETVNSTETTNKTIDMLVHYYF